MSQTKVISFSRGFSSADCYVRFMKDFIRDNTKFGDKTLIAVSGGVDSTTVAKLATKVIPKINTRDENAVELLFVDTGYMRDIGGKKESEIVSKILPDVDIIDESETFYKNTFGIKDSDKKRIAFRNTYDSIFNRESRERNCNVHMDGTIRPDKKETVDGVKEQSNVDNKFIFEKKIEPLASLYKHQVRQCALTLGLPEEVAYRQPFPGPGLSIRTVEEINLDKLETERKANDIVEQEVENYFRSNYGKPFLYDTMTGERIPFQYFSAILDNIFSSDFPEREKEIKKYVEGLTGKKVEEVNILRNKATGMKVIGEKLERVYAPVVALKILGRADPFLLQHIGTVLPEEYGYSRVLHQLSPTRKGKYLIGIRIPKSKNAMTAIPWINYKVNTRIIDRIVNEIPEVSAVYQDITPKPPGTIEFE